MKRIGFSWRQALLVPLLAMTLAACSPSWQARMPGELLPVLDDQALTARDGARLPVHKWLSDAVDPKAVIVAIHGFAQYGGVFRYPGPALEARGISVFAIDLRGNGGAPEMGVWPEHELLIEDAQALVSEVRKAHPKTPIYLLGGEFRSEVQHRGQIWYLSDAQRETVSPCRTIRISRPAREIRSLP